MLRRIARWLPFVVVCATIAILSQMGRPPLVELFDFWQADKLLHATVYGALGATAFIALATDLAGRSVLRAAWAPWALTVVYGISDEIHQSFVPGRTASVADLVADAVGAAVGIGLMLALCRRFGPAAVSPGSS